VFQLIYFNKSIYEREIKGRIWINLRLNKIF
jgi:hypothetical protein